MGMSGKRVRRRRRIYKKLVLRGFRQGISRFLAIFAIVALGVGFFVGIIATAPDMRLSSDRYYDGTDMMDVRVVSTLGLTETDVDAVRALAGIDRVMPAYSADVLLLTEDVDEFCLQILRTYPRKDAEGKDGTVEFKNVNSGDLGLETEEEKKAAEDATAENKDLFDAMKTALDGKVKEVKVSTRLKDHPVCLSADGPLSIEMEKVLSKQPGSEGVKSDKVLELNANHPVFAVLKAAQEAGDTDKINQYSALLYAQAQLIEGLPVDDPAAYAEAVCSLMK